ncbi:hypothetical protein B0533_04725 [Sedimentibacter sp. SX930]|nr:hypothetical protein B0533_04725 [Sedimentibacter sp. SX930]
MSSSRNIQRITNTSVIEDKLGFDQIYIQAKKWDCNGSVSRPEIQKFTDALLGQGATKGLYITTANFSNQAKEFTAKQLSTKIVLINGEQLARLMIDNNLSVTVTNRYEGKFVNKQSFNAETKRKAKIDNRIFTFLFYYAER